MNSVNECTVRSVTSRCSQDNNAELLICGQTVNERVAPKISPINLQLLTVKIYLYVTDMIICEHVRTKDKLFIYSK